MRINDTIEKNILNQLDKLHISFKKLELDDEDINYYLDIDLKYFVEELKNVGKVGLFMVVNSERQTVNMICNTLYKECEKDSLIKIINVSNAVNNIITYGKLFVDSKGRVVYQNAVQLCEETFDVEKQVKALVMAVLVFYQEMKKIEGKNEKN